MLKSTVTVEAVLVGIKPELMIEFWGDLFSPTAPVHLG